MLQPASGWGASPEQDGCIRGHQESRMTEEERELDQLERFLAHAAGSPELRAPPGTSDEEKSFRLGSGR